MSSLGARGAGRAFESVVITVAGLVTLVAMGTGSAGRAPFAHCPDVVAGLLMPTDLCLAIIV